MKMITRRSLMLAGAAVAALAATPALAQEEGPSVDLAELLKPTLSRALPVNGGGPPQMAAPSSGAAKPGFYNIGARTPTATR